jgi:hypothetical protein
MTQNQTVGRQPVSDWAVAAVVFAAAMMMMNGLFQAIAGLAALINDQYFVVVRGYAFDLDITAWGWIHIILGLAVAAAGVGLLTRASWARVVALIVTVLSALNNFFFIPYAPFWSLLVIALDVWIIWALTRPNILSQ